MSSRRLLAKCWVRANVPISRGGSAPAVHTVADRTASHWRKAALRGPSWCVKLQSPSQVATITMKATSDCSLRMVRVNTSPPVKPVLRYLQRAMCSHSIGRDMESCFIIYRKKSFAVQKGGDLQPWAKSYGRKSMVDFPEQTNNFTTPSPNSNPRGTRPLGKGGAWALLGKMCVCMP